MGIKWPERDDYFVGFCWLWIIFSIAQTDCWLAARVDALEAVAGIKKPDDVPMAPWKWKQYRLDHVKESLAADAIHRKYAPAADESD